MPSIHAVILPGITINIKNSKQNPAPATWTIITG